MVMRTLEIREIRYKVGRRKAQRIIKALKEQYGDRLRISYRNHMIGVKGDLHNYRLHDTIVWILSEGKHGKNLQAG